MTIFIRISLSLSLAAADIFWDNFELNEASSFIFLWPQMVFIRKSHK